MKIALCISLFLFLFNTFEVYKLKQSIANMQALTKSEKVKGPNYLNAMKANASQAQDDLIANALKDDVDAVKIQIAELLSWRDSIAKKLEKRHTAIASSPSHNSGSAHDDSAKLSQEELFQSQNVDLEWQTSAENELLANFDRLNHSNTVLYGAECRESICRLEMEYGGELADIKKDLKGLSNWPSQRKTEIDENVSPPKVVIYIAREGYDLSGKKAPIVEEDY